MPVHHGGAIRFIHLKQWIYSMCKKEIQQTHTYYLFCLLDTTIQDADVAVLPPNVENANDCRDKNKNSPGCLSETSPPVDHERAEHKKQPATRKHRNHIYFSLYCGKKRIYIDICKRQIKKMSGRNLLELFLSCDMALFQHLRSFSP